MRISEAVLSDLESFFEYIGAQLLENADDNSPLFQPISKENCVVSEQFKDKFRNGFEANLGENGWRKLWVIKDSKERVFGHIDLRHYGEEYKFHRVLLGMGVDSSLRKQGLGVELIKCVTEFCNESPSIDWLDLNVLSNNLPAKKLYLKCGFEVIGEVPDCYLIEGQFVSETMMTLCTRNSG
ncbi:GNAT family N-acetyltransferase [Vibrio splendidus]|jgi:RimJ/RimL family protein N-acetyltransferase|uniref:GNAT family N-acetyltransferase n=1 Tax=Vibrio splendidus TaxID=29497 RepID=UPI000C864272|nr:GNAT family protein [Vibrio splendidus]PMG59837.1 GNAT family N-acetyltransferase [Vibrio splendidus]PMN39951.1 GNAT family N-acetyltransferase [Vibrio splendidus]PMP43887.1 GNAT family N-acetyltransferase [Vibrio splendidus]